MALNHVVFFADVYASPHVNSVFLWNQSHALSCQEQEKNAFHVLYRVYSDVYFFDDDVDVPRKIIASGQNHRMN